MAKIRYLTYQFDSGSEIECGLRIPNAFDSLAQGAETVTFRAYDLNDNVAFTSIRNFDKIPDATMPRPENLIRFYKFNETTGDAIDETGNQNGTVFGGMTRTGEEYIGNGTNAYVDIGATSETTEYSIVTKITTGSDINTTQLLFSKALSSSNRSVYILISGGFIDIAVDSDYFSDLVEIEAETTYNIAITVKNNGNLKLYINKVIEATEPVQFTPTSTNFNIFRDIRFQASYALATIDYFAMWDIELTQTDINNIPNGTL